MARIVEEGRKTASCGSCGRALVLADLRAQWSGADADEARAVVGQVNARLQGRTMDVVPPAPRAPKHDDPWDAAAAEARALV